MIVILSALIGLLAGAVLTALLQKLIRRRKRSNAHQKIARIPIYNIITDQESGGSLPGGSRNENTLSEPTLQMLQEAAQDEVAAIVLDIRSPGGSPVAAAEIADAIWRYRNYQPTQESAYLYASTRQQRRMLKHWQERAKKEPQQKILPPIYAVIRSVGASAAYLIASSCEKIYSHPSAIVGSIGVISQRFGLQEAIKKIGIEPRTQTAGENKNMLDPFEKEDPAAREHFQTILDLEHDQFIEYVLKGRKEAFRNSFPEEDKYQQYVSKKELFSGKFWLGRQAISLGLVDQLGDLEQVKKDLEKIFKRELEFEIYNDKPKRGWGITINLAADSVQRSLESAYGWWKNKIVSSSFSS